MEDRTSLPRLGGSCGDGSGLYEPDESIRPSADDRGSEMPVDGACRHESATFGDAWIVCTICVVLT